MSRLSDILLGNNSNKEMILPNPIDRTSDTDWWGKVAADAIAAGAGQTIQTAMHGLQDLNNNPDYGKGLENWGAELANEHQKLYEPGSARYYASAGLQSLPEMGADLGISLAASAIGSPVAGAAKTLASGYKWANRIADVYKGARELSGIKGGLARMILPSSPQSAIGAMTSTGLEAAMEGQRAMDDYIEEAKRNGTYVPGVTEEEGRNLRGRVFRDNAALLALTNAAEFNSIFKKSKGLKGGLARLGSNMASEGLEEAVQQIIPKAEQGKDWSFTDPDVIESAIIGAGMGGVMHGAGRAAKAAFPSWLDPDYNPMSAEAQAAKADSDVPLPTDIDFTEADPSDVMKWLNKQSAFNGVDNVTTNVDSSQRQTSSLPQGVEVSGENSLDGFDKRFMSKYESKPGATDLANVQAKVKSAFNGLAAEYGGGLIVTGGAEKGYHAAGENGHEGGWKIDVDKASVKDPQKFLALCKKYGFAVGDEGDHFDLSGHAKGGVGGTQVVTPDTFISDGGQVQSAQPTGKREGHANAWAITDVFRRAGYNDEAIAGILGRVQQEHNFDTSDVPEHEEEGMHVGGYGMFQWNGGRTTAFLEWAKQNGKDPQNPTTQAEYALKEAQERGITPDKMNKLSAEEAADLWTKDWEVGVAGKERQYAGEWRERLKNGGGGTNSITPQDFGNILGNHMIDFAGSEDDNLTNSYQRIMDNLDDGVKSVLANRFADMYNEDGTFNNTAENRQALAQDEQGAELIRSAANTFAPQLIAPMVDKNGRISKQAVKDYFTPQIAGVNMHFLKDAIAKDKLSDTEKVAVLQEAGNQLNVPRLNKSEAEQIKFVNDLQSAIDSRDFKKIYSLMPQATAKAIAATRQPEPTAQPATAVVTPEQSEAPIQEQPPAPVAQPQGVQPALPATSNQETVQPAPQYAPETVQNAPQPVQATPAPQALPSVPTEQENAQTAAQVANKAQQIANVQGQQFDFDSRLAELQAMPLGQLEQLGQQTLANMQAAGVPVNESLANDLAAGKENAIAHAESKMAEAGVANNATTTSPTVSNQEQVQSNVASQATNEPTSDKESKTIKQFREKADKVIEQYRDDKITYQEAFAKLEEMYVKADNAAKTKDERNVAAQTFLSAGESLERARQEKESHPQKLDYTNMSLDELKAERQRLIDDEVERMNRTPGGKGTNNGYTYNDRGEITGRYGESLNPQWYQDAYAELGRAPRKKDYPGIALKNLQKHQEFAELEDAIAQKEKESVKNEPVSQRDKLEKLYHYFKDRYDLYLQDKVKYNLEMFVPKQEETEFLKSLGIKTNPIVSRAEAPKVINDIKKKLNEMTQTPKQEKPAKKTKAGQKTKPTEKEVTENVNSNEEAAPETDNAFGMSADDAFADFANLAGITPVQQEKAEPKAKSTTKKKAKKKRNMGLSDTSKEREEELKKQLSEALKKSRNRLNSTPVIFDLDVIVPAFNLGRLYVQRGAENFAEYARDMIDAVGDSVRGWLRPVWEMIENYPEGKSIDESLVIPAFRYVGSFMHNKPQATYEDVRADFVKRAGEDTAAKFDDLLKVAYSGAYRFYNDNAEVTDNELNDSTGENLERDSEGNNQDGLGSVHGDGESVSRGGQGVQQTGKGSRSQRSGSVHGRGTARSGETSDSGVQGSESERGNRDDSTGGKQLTGSRRDSYDGQAVDDSRNANSFGTAKNRPINDGNRGNKAETVKVNKDTFKAGDREQIASSMPFLMSEQVDDVVKADTRLYTNNGEGVMFTNGTGTGKTFTGLGCIKRAVQQGKKNILIIAPTDKVQNDWITTGKGFFGLDISKLENTTDAGEGIVITSYENVGANNKLVKRDWDMIVTDESHKLMQGEKGNRTKALENVRAMTYHVDGLRERFERLHAKEYDRLAELRGKASDKEHPITAAEKQELESLQAKLIKEQEKAVAEWKGIRQEDKPKVLFLSATPFSYVPDIDYAEGYLFHYDRKKNQNGGYNQPNAYDDFLIKHFGYRMRVGKLTKPDTDVNNDLMEIQFNQWLKDQGVLSGRKLKVTPDYERGYLLVDGGVGKQIDEGMKIATERGVSDSDQKYGKLHGLFENKLKGNKTRYLLEAIKAKEAVDIIKDYVKAGKKVVIFHDFKKNEAENPFVLTDEDFEYMDEVDRNTARQQYARFCKDHPELLNLNLDDLQSPIERLTAEFGDSMRIFNGDIPKKKRETAVREFQDDDSRVNIILCQRASAKEGISMHDTTGKHQRVLIDLGLATRPTDLIQGEGRIYRTGVITDAIIRYLNTGTDMEKRAFASTIAGRASTAENLSMGEEARALRNAIVEGFMESLDGDSWKKYLPGSKTEGKGGKARDSKLMDGVSPYEAAKSDYFANQKKTSKNKAQEGIDYFPTPEPIGFKMVEWLGLKPGDRALEPSAGHGAISRYFGAETRNTIVEPSPELATLAKMRLNGGTTAKVVEGRFEDLDIHNKYEGIVMNPPYGVGGKTAYEHVAKAFDHLTDGGRLIAIVPDGAAANKRLENWLNGDGTKANPGQSNAALLSEIKLPQVTFNRAGTSVATKILIIDKYNDPADLAEMERRQIEEGIDSLDLTGINDINELFDKLEYVRTPERVGADIPRHFTNSVNKKGNSSRKYITLPDDTKLLDDTRLRELAYNNRGTRDMRGGWYEFFNENDRAKFVKAANKYLVGQDALAAEQQEIVDEVLNENPKQTEHFSAEMHTDTRTNEKVPMAKIKGHLDRDSYLKVKKIAEKNGGHYSKFAGGFLFNSEDGRTAFTQEAEGYLSDDAAYSVAKNGQYHSDDDLGAIWKKTYEPIDESELTAREREIVDLCNSLGCPVKFCHASPLLNGKFGRDEADGVRKVFINRDAPESTTPWIMWHEMFHFIKKNNEPMYNKLVEHIKSKAPFSKEQLNKYRETIGRPNIPDNIVIEEMMADAFPDVRKRVPFFRDLAKENVSLYKQLVAFVKRIIDNVVSRFRASYTKGDGLTVRQTILMQNAFADMVRDIRDANQKPIFKVGKDGYRDMVDMDGNTTEQILDALGLVAAENNLADVRYSLDNSETLTDNERRALGKVKDNMSFEDVRELFLAEENHEVGKALQVYNLRERRHGKDSAEVAIAKDALEEAYQDATAKRREYSTEENVRNLARLLRGQNKAREGSYLARDLQRVIDARRNGNIDELTQIPGEYRSMYNQVEKILGITNQYSVSKHSQYEGASLDVEYFSAIRDMENAKSDSEREAARQKLVKMVEQKAKDAGFENAIPEQTVAYRTRTKAAPKKSVKVYKVFTVSNDGSPTALFIGGTEKLPQGVWLDAQDAYHFKAANGKYYVPSTQNPYTKGGKTGTSVEVPNDEVRQELIKRGFLKEGSTASKVTALAYRPGWHAGTMPFFPQGGMKPPKGMNSAYPNIHRYNQVVFECELAADKDYTQEAENQPKARKKDGSLDTRNADLQYMPEDGYYYYATNPLTHGHPELGMWAISGSLKINRALSQEECDKILADNNMAPQEWEQGEMKLEDLGYTGEQHDAARKTLAPITYDDNGNVIPLSQRFDAEKDDVRYSVSRVNGSEAPGAMERIKNATRKLLGLQEKLEDNVQDRHTEKQNAKNSLDDTLPLMGMLHSMKYLAGKNEAIKRMYYLGKRCMDEQEHLRNEFKEVIKKINTLMADESERDSLHALLWAGDADGKEYTADELRQEGFSDNVIAAYKLVRDNLAKAYTLVNDARLQVKVRNKTINASELPQFLKENFVDNSDIINTQDVGNGKIVVTYRGAKVYENRTDIVNDDMLKQLEADENIYVTDKKELGKGVYNVTYNEKPKSMGKLTGYMPHFFHRFMVYAKTKDEVGNDMRVAIGSAESLADATKIANEVAKHNPDMQFVIDTHSFEYGDENNGVVVGDLNYQEMTKRLAENTEMSLTEANKFLHDSAGATLKSRHRFFGNMMKRTGVQGFDENMMWALTHYFNSASRYVAMEHFKPDAISWYERFFGDFNADTETIKNPNKRRTARLIRQYILDVNGNPREVEKWCNAVVDRIPILGEKLNDTYNGRPALALSSKVSWFNAVTKLGCLSISSPMLNFMQFINVATMLDSVKYAKMGLNKALKPSELDNLILDRSGIMDEINLASDAGGYTQNRDYGNVAKGLGKGKQLLDKSMFFFTWCDALMRKAAVLGAYYQGVQEKGMKPDKGQTISAQALEYAREVNSESNFDYSAANTPEAIRMGSVITQQAFQFQKYPIMQFEFFWNHVVHGTNSQRVKFLAPYFLLTGLPGMVPFGELLAGFLSALIPGDDDDFAKKMKAELMRWAGNDSAKQAVVNSLTNGPLAAFTGIDISERAGMQNFFAGRYFGEKPTSTPEAITTLLGGAAVSTVTNVNKQLRNGNPIEAIKAVSPGLGNWLQAAVGETRTTHHRVGSTYDGMYERILHGMGFRHIDETNTQFINSYLYESKKRQQEDKKFIMDAYLDDPSEENREQLVFWGITDKQLKQYSEGREKSSRDRAAGEEKKKSKKPKTEAQIRDDELREFVK